MNSHGAVGAGRGSATGSPLFGWMRQLLHAQARAPHRQQGKQWRCATLQSLRCRRPWPRGRADGSTGGHEGAGRGHMAARCSRYCEVFGGGFHIAGKLPPIRPTLRSSFAPLRIRSEMWESELPRHIPCASCHKWHAYCLSERREQNNWKHVHWNCAVRGYLR